MAKRATKPVAPNAQKPSKPITVGAEISAAGGRQVKKTIAVKRADAKTIRKALDELGINKPYYSARVVGGRLELTLYGGEVAFWPKED